MLAAWKPMEGMCSAGPGRAGHGLDGLDGGGRGWTGWPPAEFISAKSRFGHASHSASGKTERRAGGVLAAGEVINQSSNSLACGIPLRSRATLHTPRRWTEHIPSAGTMIGLLCQARWHAAVVRGIRRPPTRLAWTLPRQTRRQDVCARAMQLSERGADAIHLVGGKTTLAAHGAGRGRAWTRATFQWTLDVMPGAPFGLGTQMTVAAQAQAQA